MNLTEDQSAAADHLIEHGYIVVYHDNEWHIADPHDDDDGFYLHGEPQLILEAHADLLTYENRDATS